MDSSTTLNSLPASAEFGKKVFLDPALISVDSKPICAAIGVFDGIHRGHQKVIEQSLEDARHVHGKALVLTFDKHPKEILSPSTAPPMIYSLERRLTVLASYPVDAILLLRFDEALRQQTAEAFIQSLVRQLGTLHSLSVGANFVFGYQRSGNLDLLKRLGQQMGFRARGVPPVMWQEHSISSTRIRQAIREGDLTSAKMMLGRAYCLEGMVVRGDQIGRTLGFPTANIDIGNLVCPPNGVYAVYAHLQGQTCPGVLNIGSRPTLQAGLRLQAEVHLLDFQKDIYGQPISISFAGWLRSEQKFSNLDHLKAQIAMDILQARSIFQNAMRMEEASDPLA